MNEFARRKAAHIPDRCIVESIRNGKSIHFTPCLTIPELWAALMDHHSETSSSCSHKDAETFIKIGENTYQVVPTKS